MADPVRDLHQLILDVDHAALELEVALGLGEVSVVIPLAGTAPLFVLLLAYLFPIAAEKRSWRVAVGAVMIVLGVVLLSR